MNNNYLRIAFVVLIFISFEAESQDFNKLSFGRIEDSLSVLTQKISQESSYSSKEETNKLFQALFHSALEKNGSIDYPFDSLKHIGKVKSEDRKVRVFTWNIPQSGGYQNYFGFIQIRKDKNSSLIYDLIDSRKNINDPINEILSNQNWMGALYYSIIEEHYNGNPSYILMGFDFNNIFTSKKIIEVLTLDTDLKPVFGSRVFKVGNNYMSRVVFEYSARATFMLRYIPESKIIVFDHLSPSRPDFEGNFQFYGPDFSYDGFKFENGYWNYIRDLDLRNPRRGRVSPIDTVQKLPEPGFLYKSKSSLPMQIVK